MTIDFLVHPESCLAEISTILSFRVMHLFYIARCGSLVFDNSQRYLEFIGSDLLRPLGVAIIGVVRTRVSLDRR